MASLSCEEEEEEEEEVWVVVECYCCSHWTADCVVSVLVLDVGEWL